MSFEAITTMAVAAAAGALYDLLKETIGRLARIKELSKLAKDAAAEAALTSGDIDTIGKYIYDDLGSIKLKDFTLNRKIEDKLNAAVDRVEDFFGEPEQTPVEPPRSASIPEMNLAGLPTEYDSFLDELRRGELWNCLAKLRLFTEQKLGALAKSHGIEISQHRAARQLLRALSVSVPLDHEVSNHLDYALTVCNRAIHGEDVDDDVALEAVQSAIVAFERLNKPRSEQDAGDQAPAAVE